MEKGGLKRIKLHLKLEKEEQRKLTQEEGKTVKAKNKTTEKSEHKWIINWYLDIENVDNTQPGLLRKNDTRHKSLISGVKEVTALQILQQ